MSRDPRGTESGLRVGWSGALSLFLQRIVLPADVGGGLPGQALIHIKCALRLLEAQSRGTESDMAVLCGCHHHQASEPQPQGSHSIWTEPEHWPATHRQAVVLEALGEVAAALEAYGQVHRSAPAPTLTLTLMLTPTLTLICRPIASQRTFSLRAITSRRSSAPPWRYVPYPHTRSP